MVVPGRRYSLIPMAARGYTRERVAMSLVRPSRQGGRGRDPAHALYDHACDLLVAAQGLRTMAGADRTAPAVAATFGCLEAALEAQADAVAALSRQAADLVATADGEADPAAVRIAARCEDVVRLLRLAQSGAGGIRERVGPALAELGAMR